MENKTKEELVQETEAIEEEALKANKQMSKKILKKIFIGTGVAAILGGVIAAVRSSKNDSACIDYETDSELVERTPIETADVETVDVFKSEET